MPQPVQSDPSPIASAEGHALAPVRAHGDPIYDLRVSFPGSPGYSSDVAAFSGRLLREIDSQAGVLIDGYEAFIRDVAGESPRSRGEYALEFVTLGMALDLYGGAAAQTPWWASSAAICLLTIRRRWPMLKACADGVRARIVRRGRGDLEDGWPAPGLDGLPRLLRWLRATGEFDQEAVRLGHWHAYLHRLSAVAAGEALRQAGSLFRWFEREAAAALGCYTEGVAAFLTGPYARRGVREDQFFCGKRAAEYHLGMVAAEVMNNGLRAHFESMPRKTLLVPTCMRGARASACRPRIHGLDMVCTGCDPDCAVNRITRRMRRENVPVYLVPHATGFSRWLERWQREPAVGVIAVACLLNILPGGYEMRARGIPSQCVPLDRPGCAKHWCEERVPTSVDEGQLVQIAQGA